MNKNIVVKLAILLVVLALVYSVFWFFKVGQVEKQINNFISKNSAHVSVGEIAVSGFPLSQKITLKDLKFTIPSPVLDKRHVVVKHLEAKAGIFASNFVVTLLEPVTLQDAESNSATVEFIKDPEIAVSITDGRAAKFSYKDSGYKILDAEKNIIYAAISSTVEIESSVSDDDKVVTRILANVREIEGFDVIDIYKNAFEKKVTEGIKTGEITLGNAMIVAAPSDEATTGTTTILPAVAAVVAPIEAAAAASKAVAEAVAAGATPTPAMIAAVAPSIAPTTADAAALAPDPAQQQPPVDAAAVKPEDIDAAIANSTPIKSNFMVSVEYTLTPNQSEQQAQIPTDPTQIQEAPVQYSKVVKVNSLEFSNSLYKISINGEMNTLPDDNMPSGSLALKVEKVDALINALTTGFNQIIDQKKSAISSEVQSSELSGNASVSQDSYQDFLARVVTNLSSVSKEMAAKNAVSKDDIAEFDIRREKNLEFLINETSVREILGKF